jgi:hypothetical protein
VTGGQFNNAVTETVVVPGGGGSALREFFVDITYDNFPTETSWAIVLPLATTSDITIIVGFGTSSGAEPGGSYTVSADLVPGETYDLVLLDSVGDGICCQFGEGSIEVYEAVNGQKIVLTSSDGAFGTSQILTFSVPATRTAVKTRTPECHDSVDEDFHVDDTTGSRGCAWLASNMDRFDYLCEFVDISSICPITCGICSPRVLPRVLFTCVSFQHIPLFSISTLSTRRAAEDTRGFCRPWIGSTTHVLVRDYGCHLFFYLPYCRCWGIFSTVHQSSTFIYIQYIITNKGFPLDSSLAVYSLPTAVSIYAVVRVIRFFSLTASS